MTPAIIPVQPWAVTDAWERMSAANRRQFPTRAQLVITPEIRHLAATMPAMVARSGIAVLSGPPGSGKTTAAAAVAAVAAVRTVYLSLPPGSRDRPFWQQVHTALTAADADTGTGSAAGATISHLQDQVRAHLILNHPLLIVDEAQNVSLRALLSLRWLTDVTNGAIAILLVGAGLNERINDEPQLATRVGQRVLVGPKAFGELEPLLREYHPLLASTSNELLAKIDACYARGSWRAWSHLVATLGSVGITNLTPHTARLAIMSISGSPPW